MVTFSSPVSTFEAAAGAMGNGRLFHRPVHFSHGSIRCHRSHRMSRGKPTAALYAPPAATWHTHRMHPLARTLSAVLAMGLAMAAVTAAAVAEPIQLEREHG